MRALRAYDPEEIGGHRLLARLGEGGMGVVYLARSRGGAVVALKVIRAEHAADALFRARFRREAEIARGLAGPWLVPVTAADADADEPWLATAYVPGPSLSEAVRKHGPLPEPSARLLGARLASALADVHAAGLVHRDVKPGNVLLGLDGPRLIDFGIARPAGPSALTRSDMIVGTPGFLAPEQTRATGDEVGPASDVFGLGCVVAHAASGRRPFGTGDIAAVLFRTVHEEPDLAGLPGSLAGTVRECLAKDPEARPTAARLRESFRADPRAPRDPRGPQAEAATRAGTGTGTGTDWLPPAVLGMVAARSSAALDPPAREPGRVPHGEPVPATHGADNVGATGSGSGAPRTPPSRRRLLAVGAAGAATLLTGGVTAYLATRPGDAAAEGSGSGPERRPVVALAYQADLSGAGRSTGRAQERGVRLAVTAHNARQSSRFTLDLRTFDDGGTVEGAKRVARKVIADPAIRAVIGPTVPAAARAAGALYERARLATVLVNLPESEGVATTGLDTLLLTRSNDSALTTAVLDYLSRVREVTRTAVLDDRDGGDLSWDWTSTLREFPPSEGTTTVRTLPDGGSGSGSNGTGSSNGSPGAAQDQDRALSETVRQALATRPGAVVYSGVSPRRAARCARALAEEGFTGSRVSFEPVMTPAFLAEAGAAAEGWRFGASYADPRADDRRIAAFRKAHRARYEEDPGRWAVEAYDAVGLLARALGASDDLAGVSRAAVVRQLLDTRHEGLAKALRYTPDRTHALAISDTQFLYGVRDGAYVFLGPHGQVDDDT